jgi:hypothetical protein
MWKTITCTGAWLVVLLCSHFLHFSTCCRMNLLYVRIWFYDFVALTIITVGLQKHGMRFQEKLLQILRKWYVSMYMIMKFYQVKRKLQLLISFWGRLQCSLQIFYCIIMFQFTELYRNLESLWSHFLEHTIQASAMVRLFCNFCAVSYLPTSLDISNVYFIG